MFNHRFLLALLAATATTATASTSLSNIVPGAFIIELEDTADLSTALKDVHVSKTVDLNSSIFRGASIQFDTTMAVDQRVAQLKSLSAVKNVWPKTSIPRPDARVSWTGPPGLSSDAQHLIKRGNSSDTFSTHVLTQVDKLHAKGITGKGIKIAIIDTGIDYTNEALGGCFGPGCLVESGYDYVGDKYNGTDASIPVPDDDPYDGCAGHGTHVAGIIAAQKNPFGFTGAAPGVKLAAYRVFGCTGPSNEDAIIAAGTRAIADGAQIISLSLGYSNGWPETALSAFFSRIVEKGIIVTISAGNSGDSGLFYASSPAVGKGIASIASFDNSVTPTLYTKARYNVAGSEEKNFEFINGLEKSDWSNVTLPLWALSFNTTEVDQACNPLPENTPDLSDKIVLIRRGTCFFEVKAKNVRARGAKYFLIYNNVPESLTIGLAVDGIVAYGGIVPDTAKTWIKQLAEGKTVTLNMPSPKETKYRLEETINNVTGGYVSSYSSWGPTFENEIAPRFGTPGGAILSTYPVALGSYALMSGTSMAAPFAAGVYALVASVRGTFAPDALQNVLAATSKSVNMNKGSGADSLLAPVAQQGAGLLQAYDAAYTTTILSTSGLSFNDTVRLINTQNFTISNVGSRSITYELGVMNAATAYTFSTNTTPDGLDAMILDASYAQVKLSEYQVTLPAGGKTTIAVQVKPPTVDPKRLPVYSGFITLNTTSGEHLSLPYQGIVGDLTAHPVLNSTYVSRSTDGNVSFPAVPSNATFVLSRTNATNTTDVRPVSATNFLFGSPLVNVEILAVGNSSHNLGHAMGSPIRYSGRSIQGFLWNGQLDDGKGTYVPAGAYKFRVSALRIFADEKDKSKYDVAESPAFTIKYQTKNYLGLLPLRRGF